MKARTRNRTKEIALIGLFAAVTALLSQISFYIPLSPVPISFGIMAVFITGLLLNPRSAFFSLLVYLGLGAIGLPIFSGGRGGLGIIVGATGGFLFSYPIAALFISVSVDLFTRLFNPENTKVKKYVFPAFAFIVLIIALFICYLIGTLYLARLLGMTFKGALSAAVYPFVLLDILKIVACVVLIVPLRSRLARR
ncbi:MAG: biotin transporter BioY [Clostridia bacterium]